MRTLSQLVHTLADNSIVYTLADNMYCTISSASQLVYTSAEKFVHTSADNSIVHTSADDMYCTISLQTKISNFILDYNRKEVHTLQQMTVL